MEQTKPREGAGERLISNGDWAGVNKNPLPVLLKSFYWIAYWKGVKTDHLFQQEGNEEEDWVMAKNQIKMVTFHSKTVLAAVFISACKLL